MQVIPANAAEDLLTLVAVVMEESHSVRNTDESSTTSNDFCDDDDFQLEPELADWS